MKIGAFSLRLARTHFVNLDTSIDAEAFYRTYTDKEAELQ